jgi:hypothetical protein
VERGVVHKIKTALQVSNYRNITVCMTMSNKLLIAQKNVLFCVDIYVRPTLHFGSGTALLPHREKIKGENL